MQNAKNETTTATTQNKGGFLDVLFKLLKGSGADTSQENGRKIICKDQSIPKDEKEGAPC